MHQEHDIQEQNETDDAATTRIRERVQALHEKTAELNRTLDGVEQTLKEAKGDSNA